MYQVQVRTPRGPVTLPGVYATREAAALAARFLAGGARVVWGPVMLARLTRTLGYTPSTPAEAGWGTDPRVRLDD